jgi:putative transposase
MMLCYKYRLYPSKQQETTLLSHLDICRQLYNTLLSLKSQQHLGRNKLSALLPPMKECRPELNEVYSKALQTVNDQLHHNLSVLHALKLSGKRVGRLRFKKENRYRTLNYNQSGFSIDGKHLSLSKIGSIPIKLHRPLVGNIKGVLITHAKSGKWFAIFQCEQPSQPLPPCNRSVGIDVGLKHFLTDSDGRQLENPRYYRKTEHTLKAAQRSFSRKRKGSSNRNKARIKVARISEKLTNQRDDFLHKLSRYYVNHYGLIAVEGLKIRNMVRNHNYAKSILDASWGKFFQLLSCKAESAGRTLRKVNPRGTSQEYNHGLIDRDYNASLNILERGLSEAGSGRPFEPVETRPILAPPVKVPASLVVEAGSPQPFRGG